MLQISSAVGAVLGGVFICLYTNYISPRMGVERIARLSQNELSDNESPASACPVRPRAGHADAGKHLAERFVLDYAVIHEHGCT